MLCSNSRWAWRLRMMDLLHLLLLLVVLLLHQIHGSTAQQAYVNNKQLDCDNNYTNTGGYMCNGASKSCLSYLTFRSTPTYNSPAGIGRLLGADPSAIARINNITNIDTVPTDTVLIVPTNCSCYNNTYYQHNASYTLQLISETYFTVANNTYEGLTTCQALIAQNSYNYRNLAVGLKLAVPLRCACPTSDQIDAGIKYLLTYLITWRDTVQFIADSFGADNQSVYHANNLTADDLIFPFTPILVPLKTEPTKINTAASPPPSPPSLPIVPVGNQSTSSNKGVFIGAGVGGAVLLLIAASGFLFWFSRRHRRSQQSKPVLAKGDFESAGTDDYSAIPGDTKSWSEGIRYAIESLTVYKYEELQKATGDFGEANRIKGSVYMGCFKDDKAAIKVMKGDVSSEINILKQINHSNIIRLSGFCVHDGNTYLVYEYAENGSLADWLLQSRNKTGLAWKLRVQIAYDAADGLNYLHNYTNPPYIHKNLKSSNILLDSELRAKLANFGLARSLEENQDLQLTRHVVGTYGYMAPEYIENGLMTPKLDVYAFGVVVLELLSGREAAYPIQKNGEDKATEAVLLSACISEVLEGENVREKLQEFIDPCLGNEYPLDMAYSLAQLANKCVARDLNSRPPVSEVFMTLSKILSSSMDWDSSYELDHSVEMR